MTHCGPFPACPILWFCLSAPLRHIWVFLCSPLHQHLLTGWTFWKHPNQIKMWILTSSSCFLTTKTSLEQVCKSTEEIINCTFSCAQQMLVICKKSPASVYGKEEPCPAWNYYFSLRGMNKAYSNFFFFNSLGKHLSNLYSDINWKLLSHQQHYLTKTILTFHEMCRWKDANTVQHN